jgi:hypothetical protein
MRNIRRAFQRKPFHLWMPEIAVARGKRRKRLLRLGKGVVTSERLPGQGGIS